MIYIGIDPDSQANGVAVFWAKEKKLALDTMWLPDLIRFIEKTAEEANGQVKVVVEKGEANKVFFTSKQAVMGLFKAKKVRFPLIVKGFENPALNSIIGTAARSGSDTGKNFQMTDVILQFMRDLKIPHETYVPRTAKWPNHKKFAPHIQGYNIRQSNQEERDAFRCIHKYFKRS